MARGTLAVALAITGLLAIGPRCLADTNQLKVQGSWAYMKRSDGPARPVEYMATTPSAEDGDVWFLLVCGQQGQMDAAIIYADGFPYQVRRPLLQLTLRLDDSPAISVAAAPVEARQITIDPRLARDLVLLLAYSTSMTASVPEANGRVHLYRFSLQPNDLALRAIELRCAIREPE